MNFTFFVILWCVLGAATLALALYRKLLANHEDDVLALGAGEEGRIPVQAELARRIDVVDRAGKTITLVTAVSGLVLGGVYLYQAWLQSNLIR